MQVPSYTYLEQKHKFSDKVIVRVSEIPRRLVIIIEAGKH